MRHLLLVTASVLSLGLAAQGAFAAMAEDAAYNKNDKPVYDSEGHCVRTLWQGKDDPCAPAIVAVAPVIVPAPPPAPIPVVALEQRTIYFDFNKTTLTAEGTKKLDQLASIINESVAITEVKIHGYTDQIGSNSYNDALASKRAAVVKNYLDSKSRLKADEGDIRGLGKAPTDGACKSIKKRTDKIACMSQQRRVEVEFKAKQEVAPQQ